MVESQPSKLLVAGSIPVSRSILDVRYAHSIGPSGVAKSRRPRDDSKADVAQLVEHSLGKGEVTSSILVIGSKSLKRARKNYDDWFRTSGN